MFQASHLNQKRSSQKITNLSKYIDFFGSSDKGSIANTKINEMLDEIEELYDNDATPSMLQVLVYDHECDHCKASLPVWKKLTVAIEKRLPRYNHGMTDIVETVTINGTPLYIGDQRMTGGLIYKKYNAMGVPFVLQNFKVEQFSRRNMSSKNIIVSVPFFISHTGEITAPFSFLASIFHIQNRWMDSRIAMIP